MFPSPFLIADVGEHMKETVQNVTNEIGGVFGGKKPVKEDSNLSEHINKTDLSQTNGHDGDNPDYKIIPLKDPNKQIVDENLENIKNNILKKAQSFSDDTEQMADDIIKETEDLIRDAETVASDSVTEMTTRITSSEDGTIEILNLEGNHTKTPTHSIDSLVTSSPEPEIERILDNEPKCPPTPEATMNSMLSSDGAEVSDSAPTVQERQSQDKKPEQGHDGSKREA